jgi:hypothetical protein
MDDIFRTVCKNNRYSILYILICKSFFFKDRSVDLTWYWYLVYKYIFYHHNILNLYSYPQVTSTWAWYSTWYQAR